MSINTSFYKGASKEQIRNVLNPFQYLIRVEDLAPAPIIETHFTQFPEGLEQGPVGVNTVEEPVRKTGTHQK